MEGEGLTGGRGVYPREWDEDYPCDDGNGDQQDLQPRCGSGNTTELLRY